MQKSIEIRSIEQKQHNGILSVTFELGIRGKKYNLSYKVSGGIEQITLICDAVVVSFIVYAIKFDLCFFSKYPITEKLYYNLTNHVIPQMSVANKTEKEMIRINMPITKDIYNGKWVGTGISLGVDSFATMHEYLENCELEEYRLTHLVHLKTGAHHGQLGYFDQQREDDLFLTENKKIKKFCEENGYDLIVVESNLFAITSMEFGYGFDTTHTFRNLGCILLLQNYFGKYYYASAYNLDRFNLSLSTDTAYYEKWALPYISNESLALYSANTNMTRIQKTKYIAQFKDTYDNLHVCWHESENCGQCKKCKRTLVSLDVLGEIDKYSKSFDLDCYYKNRNIYIAEVILLRHIDVSYMEIYKYMLECKFKMPSLLWKIKAALKITGTRLKKMGIVKFIKHAMQVLVR